MLPECSATKHSITPDSTCHSRTVMAQSNPSLREAFERSRPESDPGFRVECLLGWQSMYID